MNIVDIPVGMLGTNCYILASEAGACAVIDPGAQAEKIIREINEHTLNVKYILFTHGHYDHIDAVERVVEEYPEAQVYIGKNEIDTLTNGRKSIGNDFIIKNAGRLEDGQELILDELTIRVLETPGHSKGGVCYVCRDVIFSGDTLFCGDVGRCDLYGGDYGVMKASLRKLIALEGDYRVYPGHGPGTSLNAERTRNPYIAEAAAE